MPFEIIDPLFDRLADLLGIDIRLAAAGGSHFRRGRSGARGQRDRKRSRSPRQRADQSSESRHIVGRILSCRDSPSFRQRDSAQHGRALPAVAVAHWPQRF